MTSLLFHCTLLFQLFCILPNFSLHLISACCPPGWISEWLSSPESSTWTMWPCVRNLLLSYSSACSFTALLPWLQGGRGMMCACTPWWHFTGIRTRKKKRKSEVLRRDDFTNTKDGCRCRQPWETPLENYRGVVWLTAFEKCIALASSSLSPPSKLLIL